MGHGLVAGEDGGEVVALERDEGALVAHRVAVVGRAEHGDALAVVRKLVALVLDLVAADHVVQAVELQEPVGDVGAELAADAALGRRAAGKGLGVGPQELAHDAVLGWLAVAGGGTDVV